MPCELSAKSGTEVIKLFSYSNQLSTKFILLINVKMPTIVHIFHNILKNLTFQRRPKELVWNKGLMEWRLFFHDTCVYKTTLF